MTMMDPRPWSPASAHIGPDDDDLEMLVSTGDPEADLGSAVLAVHRVGAAACEAVARAPLPDDFRLIDALARARDFLAAPAVEAVAKCVSSDRPEVYADLLLRDLFDGGEAGAIAVYRACVSKGVAPPLAAQRAGLVYGVPHEELGRYLAIATEAKSHPVAIADAADRAVTKWASAVVRDEMTEVVSKAVDINQYNQTEFGHEHPKGAKGRFVDVMDRPPAEATSPSRGQVAGRPVGFLARMRRDTGMGGQAAPEVDGEVIVAAQPVTVSPRPAVTAPRRVQRRQRMQRVQRTESVQTDQKVKVSIKAGLQSRAKGDFGPKLKQQLNAQRARRDNVEDLTAVNHADEDAISQEFRQPLGEHALSWATSLDQADTIYHAATGLGTEENPKRVRMGDLQRILAEPYEYETDQNSAHQQMMRNQVEDVAGDGQPRFIHMSHDELEAEGINTSSDDAASRVKAYARRVGYYDQLSRDPDGTANPLLAGMMGVAPSADPGSGDWYLVLNPEPAIYGGEPEIPAAAELVITDPTGNTARLNIEGGNDRQRYYEMDPTQHWAIHEPLTLWKQISETDGYWVDRYNLTPIEEWHDGKAVATQQRWRTEPRAANGEWTRGGFLARVGAKPTVETPEVVTPVVTPIRTPRTQRAQRQQRLARPVQVDPKANVEARVQVNAVIPARLLHEFHTGLSEDSYEVIDTTTPSWDDRRRYVVYSAEDWDHLVKQTGYRGYPNEIVTPLLLTGEARNNLAERMDDAVDGADADSEVRLHVENEIMDKHRDERREVKSLRFRTGDDDENPGVKWYDLGKRIRNMMAVDQSIQSVRIDPGANSGDYRVMVNKHPVSDVVVVVLPDDYDPDKPITLQFTGRARQSAMNRNIDRYHDEALHVDAPVQMFRAVQGTKAVWHARQDE